MYTLKMLSQIPLGQVVPKNMQLEQIIKEMELICKQQYGIGLSAVQLGIPLNLFIIKHTYRNYYLSYINCTYYPHKWAKIIPSEEGCLSLPCELYRVKRYDMVWIEGENIYRGKFKQVCSNITFQHEIDHQNGILIRDIGVRI